MIYICDLHVWIYIWDSKTSYRLHNNLHTHIILPKVILNIEMSHKAIWPPMGIASFRFTYESI